MKKLLFVGILASGIGFASLGAMDNEVQAFFKPQLKEITQRIDANLKQLLEFFWYDSSNKRYQIIYQEIEKDMTSLLDYMKKDVLDWHPELIKEIFSYIQQQLLFSENESQTQREAKIIVAVRMKNYLFELFNQARVKKQQEKNELEIYLSYFSFKEESIDTRSLKQILQEYDQYKQDFAYIEKLKPWFEKIDKEINDFKKNNYETNEESSVIESSNDNETFASICYDVGLIILVLDNCNQRNQASIALKNYITQHLNELKDELKRLPALTDPLMKPHTKFLNLLLELAAKDCKAITMYDSVNEYNPKHSISHYINTTIGKNLLNIGKKLNSTGNFLDIPEKNIDTCLQALAQNLAYVDLVDDLDKVLCKPLFDCLVRILSVLISNQKAVCYVLTKEKQLLGTDQLAVSIKEIQGLKEMLSKNFNLTLVDVKGCINLIGYDRLGILLKLVLRMASNDPENFKKIMGTALHKVIEKVHMSMKFCETTIQSYAFTYFSKALTKKDTIKLLSYVAQQNKEVVNNNKTRIINKMIGKESSQKSIEQSSKNKHETIDYKLQQAYKAYKLCRENHKKTLESYKSEENRLMIRIVEESNWDKKQNLERQLAALRLRIESKPVNTLFNKVESRYNELKPLWKSE